MQSSGRTGRERLYDVFSANLGIYVEEHRGHFVCPLCRGIFGRDEIETELSRAHVWPESLGGREYTLSCTKCNNKVGDSIEICEIERTKFRRALSGSGEETVRGQIMVRRGSETAGPIQVEMQTLQKGDDRAKFSLKVLERASNPEEVRRSQELFKAHETPLADDLMIQLTAVETRSKHRSELTYLHAAFLHLFHQFGYEWVLNPTCDVIRQQINNPREEQLGVTKIGSGDFPGDPARMGLLLVNKPASWQGFLVTMPHLARQERRVAVWMPLFDRPYQAPPKQERIQFGVVAVPDFHRWLSQPISMWQGHRFMFHHVTDKAAKT